MFCHSQAVVALSTIKGTEVMAIMMIVTSNVKKIIVSWVILLRYTALAGKLSQCRSCLY